MAAHPLVLATDLDGTFAGGTAADRSELVRHLRLARACLIYVTGRTPDSVHELRERHQLPEPDVLIADVGTSVVAGSGPDRITGIEDELDRLWPGTSAVADRLAGISELDRQAVAAPRRVSYWIRTVRERAAANARDVQDPFAARGPGDNALDAVSEELAAQAAALAGAALADLDVDILVSANLFLDVLPRNVNKGTTLQRVLQWLDADVDRCVVAGDSLNDMPLFALGLRGIVVGNAEPALSRDTAGMPLAYHARAHGAAGVLEGLRHHGHLLSQDQETSHGR